MKYWASYGQAKHTSDVPEARKRAMPRLLGVLRARRSWQGHAWDGLGGLVKKMAFSQNVWPSAAPPLLPLFHGADANTPTPASCEATDLQEAVTCEFE